ncbi:hypothetical protein CDL12_17931 [Handroanthus impetiginosus]|uniref:DUF4283 domain-containing protein n=1 Tax=Handroanthus impetiginosus TaxID=429701 RepID=A0A2G9GW21_9LAMI|nr:hypothetical protein CDL12_17931 [Handroanthus impetiginosus]
MRTEVPTFSLVKRVASNRIYSLPILKEDLTCLIQPIKNMNVQLLGNSHFSMNFHDKLDMKHALERCPWLVVKYALLLREIHPSNDPMAIPLGKMLIVVRIRHLSPTFMNIDVAKQIGLRIGGFLGLL